MSNRTWTCCLSRMVTFLSSPGWDKPCLWAGRRRRRGQTAGRAGAAPPPRTWRVSVLAAHAAPGLPSPLTASHAAPAPAHAELQPPAAPVALHGWNRTFTAVAGTFNPHIQPSMMTSISLCTYLFARIPPITLTPPHTLTISRARSPLIANLDSASGSAAPRAHAVQRLVRERRASILLCWFDRLKPSPFYSTTPLTRTFAFAAACSRTNAARTFPTCAARCRAWYARAGLSVYNTRTHAAVAHAGRGVTWVSSPYAAEGQNL